MREPRLDSRFPLLIKRSDVVAGHSEGKLTKSERDEDQQEVNEPMLELVVAARCGHDRTPQAGSDADADTSDHAADEQVP